MYKVTGNIGVKKIECTKLFNTREEASEYAVTALIGCMGCITYDIEEVGKNN